MIIIIIEEQSTPECHNQRSFISFDYQNCRLLIQPSVGPGLLTTSRIQTVQRNAAAHQFQGSKTCREKGSTRRRRLTWYEKTRVGSQKQPLEKRPDAETTDTSRQ